MRTLLWVLWGLLMLYLVGTYWYMSNSFNAFGKRAILSPGAAFLHLFTAGAVAVGITGLNPLHLIWWFPVSFVLGAIYAKLVVMLGFYKFDG